MKSGPNRSAAVMQQRQKARDALDDFPTPPYATRAACEWLKARGNQLENCTVREPCANRGYMVAPLAEYFQSVHASDVMDYGAGFEVRDYLFGHDPKCADWTFMNPPFRLAGDFIMRALRTSDVGVAAFVRTGFLEGEARYHSLFTKYRPTAVLQFVDRVVIHKGVMRQKGQKYVDDQGVQRTASSATAYCWLVWEPHHYLDPRGWHPKHTELHWLPPRRAELERQGDYDHRGCDD